MLTITRDINVISVGQRPVINLSQYDDNFQLVFNLYASNGAFTMPAGTTAQIQGTKTDGNGYSAEASVSGNSVTVTGHVQMTAAAGPNVYEIATFYNNKRLSTINFILMVERAALDSDTVSSESVIKDLSNIPAAVEQAEAAADRAEEAARTLTIDPTLTQSGQAADAKVTGDEISDLKEDFDNITSYRDVFNGFVHKTVSGSGYVITDNNATSVLIDAKSAYYIIKASGNMNRFILFGVNTDLSATEVYRYTNNSVPNPAEYTYHNTDYAKILLIVYYGSGASVSVSLVESPTETIPNFEVNGIDIYTKKETNQQIKEEIIASTSYHNIFDGIVNKWVSNGKLATNRNCYGTIFESKNNYYYHISITGNQNRFILYGLTGTVATEIFRYENTNVPNPAEYTFQNTGGYASYFVMLRFDANVELEAECTIIETENEKVPAFSVNGINIFTKAEFKDTTNYKNIFAEIEHKAVFSGTVAPSRAGYATIFEATKGKCYTIAVDGNLNRFILYGLDGITATEIFRYETGKIPNPVKYEFQNSYDYTQFFVMLRYDESIALSAKCEIIESDVLPVPQFRVNGVPVMTEESNKGKQLTLKTLNIKLPGSSIANDGKNLCLAAIKSIYRAGEVPDSTGYLYYDRDTQKFYYSNNMVDNPVYVFDWDSSLANNDGCSLWTATITADGDVIFLKDHAKANPIVYPHTDYTSPYVVDFGESRKPYAWLVGSSVVQFNDGSFVFGDYAFHSLTDEQNDDRRIIWRVEKPYNNPANWVQAHSFKHVYYTSSKSDEPDNEIGHIHAIMYDYIADDLYCTTGDIDRHCRMWISDDRGETWTAVPDAVGTTDDTIVQSEGQKWRMTNAVFTDNGIWWATDAQNPYHWLWHCERDENSRIDFSTLVKVCNVEIFGIPADESQRTYITALYREPYGLLLIDRGEPRGDKLNLTFYDFKTQQLSVVAEYERATTDAGDLENNLRIGLPMSCTTIYQPECVDGIVTGGSINRNMRPNNTSIFNNSIDNYVGAMLLRLD